MTLRHAVGVAAAGLALGLVLATTAVVRWTGDAPSTASPGAPPQVAAPMPRTEASLPADPTSQGGPASHPAPLHGVETRPDADPASATCRASDHDEPGDRPAAGARHAYCPIPTH